MNHDLHSKIMTQLPAFQHRRSSILKLASHKTRDLYVLLLAYFEHYYRNFVYSNVLPETTPSLLLLSEKFVTVFQQIANGLQIAIFLSDIVRTLNNCTTLFTGVAFTSAQ